MKLIKQYELPSLPAEFTKPYSRKLNATVSRPIVYISNIKDPQMKRDD